MTPRFTTRGGRVALAAPLVLLVILAACGDDDGSASPTTAPRNPPEDATQAPTEATEQATAEATPEPTQEPTAEPNEVATEVPAAASTGCGGGVVPEVGQTELTLSTDDGMERSYLRFIPSGYDATTPLPVVLNFHGLSGTATAQALLSAYEGLAEAEGFIVVHPQGSTPAALGVPFWNISVGAGATGAGAPGLAVDDVGFVGQLLDQLETDLCVDTNRVFSTGLSNGGFFSSRLACDLPDRIAAIVTVAAVMHPDDCDPSRAVPVLSFHGTADTIVPFAGGGSTLATEGPLAGLVGQDDGADGEALRAFFQMSMADEVGEWAPNPNPWPGVPHAAQAAGISG